MGLARTPAKAQFLIEQYGVEVRPGDYDDAATLQESLRGIDAVLLVSGMAAPEERIQQHRNVINAARENGVQKIVYTSIQGAEEDTAFSPVVQSNRQTEADVRDSGLDWVIGRNGIYIEPDIEYLDGYRAAGTVANCAGEGKCGYTTYGELAYAYAQMLTDEKHNGHTYNLHGEAITQQELVDYLNSAFGTRLTYTELSFADFVADRQAELGEFLGTVIGGIYQGIREGKTNNPSDYETAAGRPHVSWDDYFAALKTAQASK